MTLLRLLWILALSLLVAVMYGVWGVFIMGMTHVGGYIILFPLRIAPGEIRVLGALAYTLCLMYLSVHWFGWGCFAIITLSVLQKSDSKPEPPVLKRVIKIRRF